CRLVAPRREPLTFAPEKPRAPTPALHLQTLRAVARPFEASMRALPILGRGATFVVYRGPSAINGAPIVAILTGADGSSANAKNGPNGPTVDLARERRAA